MCDNDHMGILLALAFIFIAGWFLISFRRVVVLFGCPALAYLLIPFGIEALEVGAPQLTAIGILSILGGAWMVLCFLVMLYWTLDDIYVWFKPMP